MSSKSVVKPIEALKRTVCTVKEVGEEQLLTPPKPAVGTPKKRGRKPKVGEEEGKNGSEQPTKPPAKKRKVAVVKQEEDITPKKKTEAAPKKKKDTGAKFPKARRIFSERNQQIAALTKKIDNEIESKDHLVDVFDKLKAILEDKDKETRALHKQLKALKKDDLPVKVQKDLDKSEILKTLNSNWNKMLKVLSTCLKEVDSVKKHYESERERLETIKVSMRSFVDETLADYQKLADEVVYTEKGRSSQTGRPQHTELVTNIFRGFKYPTTVRSREKSDKDKVVAE